MAPEELSDQIAKHLSGLWCLHPKPEFLSYVRSTYGANIQFNPTFQHLIIGQTEEGDLMTGPRGGLIRHWWIVNDGGIREVDVPKFNWDTDLPFYPTPEILFFIQGQSIAIAETLGSRLRRWKSARLVVSESTVAIIDIMLI